MAVLIALLYGLLAGAAFSPLPADARVAASIQTLARQQGAAITTASSKAVVAKPKRGSPEPIDLPVALAAASDSSSYPAARPVASLPVIVRQNRPNAYRARAPPVA